MAAEVQALQRVSAVIVTYNSAAVVASCLRSLGGVREVVVVDNNSADSTIETVRAAMPRARIIASADNLGYGAAANIGFQQASGEFALLINPDAALRPQAIERLVAAADRYENAAVLAPVLVDSRTQIQRSHNASLMERDSMARKRSDPVPEGDVSAGFLSGAVLLLRKCALQSAGGFDPAIFLYYEDDDLSLRMRRAGFGLVLVADAVAEHIGGASLPWTLGAQWRANWHMGWSRLYLERKHRGTASMLRVAALAFGRLIVKLPGDLVLMSRGKLVRDLARICGTLCFLIGIKAR